VIRFVGVSIPINANPLLVVLIGCMCIKFAGMEVENPVPDNQPFRTACEIPSISPRTAFNLTDDFGNKLVINKVTGNLFELAFKERLTVWLIDTDIVIVYVQYLPPATDP